MKKDDFETLRDLLREKAANAGPGPKGDTDRKQAEMLIAGLGILERFVVAIEMLSIPQPKG